MALSFQYPHLLHVLWLLPLLTLLAWQFNRWQQQARSRFGGMQSRGLNSRIGAFLLLFLIGVLGVLVANPRWHGARREVMQKGCDILVAIDLSNSMLTEDIRPNRLVVAQHFVQKLIQKAEGNRIGIIVFAGSAYLQMPLSTDYPQAIDIVQQLDVNMISAQGTVIPSAIELARHTFEPVSSGEAVGRVLIVITDGENHDADSESAASTALSKDGILTFAIGAGTPEGGPIPMPGGYFKQDEKGDVVQSKLNEPNLIGLARGGGTNMVYRIDQGDEAINGIMSMIHEMPRRNLLVYAADEREPLFQWLLLPCILLLAGILYLHHRR